MSKEQLQKLNDLVEKRAALSGIVSQNERLKTNIDAELGQGGFIIVPPRKKIQREMSFGEVKDVANYNLRNTPEKVEEKKQLLKSKIEDDTRRRHSIIEEVEHEIEDFAPVYVAVLNTLTDEVTELAELTVQGGLTDEEFQPFKEDFDRIATLPDQIPALKRGLEKLKTSPEVSDKDSVPPGILVDKVEFPQFEKDPTDTGKPETEQSLPKLRVEKARKVTITNEAGDKSLVMRQNSHQFALLDFLLSNPGLAINYFDFSDILDRRGSSTDARTMILGLGKKLKEIYPDIDLITEVSMGLSGTYHHRGFKLNAEVELIEPTSQDEPLTKELPEPIPTETPAHAEEPGKPLWLEEYYRDPNEGAELDKTKVKIQLLPDNQLRIGERIIKLSGKHHEGQKDYSNERVSALKVLIEKQGEMLSPHEVWEIAFPNQTFDRHKMVQIKAWLDNNITYRKKKIVSHNGKRGLGSKYGITDFNVELIEPGKSKDESRKSAPNKEPQENLFKPKTEDVFEFPDGTKIKGRKAKLAQILAEELSNPMLYMTSEDLSTVFSGDADQKSRNSMTSNLAQLKRLFLKKMEIEIHSSFDPKNPKQEVRYWTKRIGDQTPDALYATLHLLPTPERLMQSEKPVETTTGAEAAALVEDERLNIIPTIEEATLLVGYFKFYENILEEIGINPPPDYLRDMLENALGDKNSRKEEDIRELRKNGFGKIKKLIKDDILTNVLDELDADDPRFDFLRYFKDFESLQIEYQRMGSKQPHHISVINFLDMLLNSQIDLTKVTNIRNYIRTEQTDENEIVFDGTETNAEIIFEAAAPAPDTVTDISEVLEPETIEVTEEFVSAEEVTVFPQDEEEPAAELKEIEKQFTGIREQISGVVDLVLGHPELNQGLRRRDISNYFIGIRQKDIDRAINSHYIDVATVFRRRNRPGQSDHLSPAAVATIACLKKLPQELPRELKLEVKELVNEEIERREMEQLAEEIQVLPDEQDEATIMDLAAEPDRVWTDHYVEAIKSFTKEQLGGFDPNGVHPKVAQRRFPFMTQSFIRNAFERNVLPKKSLKSRGGGVLLTHEALVRLYFDNVATEGGMSRPEKLGMERAIREVRRENEREAAEKAARGDEDQFIEG